MYLPVFEVSVTKTEAIDATECNESLAIVIGVF